MAQGSQGVEGVRFGDLRIGSFFFLKYIFLGVLPLMDRLVEIDRKQEGGMTCRIRPLGAGFEPGSPAARTIASTREAGALPKKKGCISTADHISCSLS